MRPSVLAGFVEELDVARLHPPSRALRSVLGPLDELMASIDEKGLLQPLVVRPRNVGFEVVAGHRRLEACRRLGMRRVPCHVLELSDKEAFETSLIENVQHKSLVPMEEAEAFRKYVHENGYGSASELAKRIGKSHSYVSRRMALLNLPEEVRDQLVRGRTTPSAAQELLSLNDSEKEWVAKAITDGGVTRSEVRGIVSDTKAKRDESNRSPFAPPEKERTNRKADRALARCIVSLRISLARFDDVLNGLEDDDWVVREHLLEYRNMIHSQIDNLMRLRRKVDLIFEQSGHL